MSTNTAKRESVSRRWLLIVAQLLALLTMVLGLQFLFSTTGGTLFAFASLGPALVLGAIVILAGVGLHSFVKRHALFEHVTFQPGDVIFHQGDEGDSAYFIQEGEVEVLRENGNATAKVVAKLARGQYFGEMALLSNAPRNATVRAATQTRVAILGKANFVAMCSLLPSAQEAVMKTAQIRARREERQD